MKADFVTAKGPKINFAVELAKRNSYVPGVGTHGKEQSKDKRGGRTHSSIDKAIFTLTTKGGHRGWK
jgi:hypothetical protein